ncbi:MAG: type II and III secretion system protein family protein [Proteobacteria bacterium]|nr:type II and III secretion system protein family protein [Pseudomonadota bacterium]
MQQILFKILLLVIAISLGVCIPGGARGAKAYNKIVQLTAGKADTVELTGPVADVLVANPAIADVGTLRSNRLYIVGRTVGETNVLAYDDTGNQLGNITIRVRLDDNNLQNTLKEFFPNEKISAKTIKDNVVLSGTVSSPSVSNQVRDLAARFITDKSQTLVDLMTVRGEQQVMIKVRVLEADRTVLRDLGLETDYRPNATRGFKLTGSNIGLAGATPFGTGSLLLGQTGAFGPFSSTLRALETNGILNTLAEPNLTAISGETAGFLAGGEYPVPSGRDSQGNISVTFKQFGVALNFTPTVLTKERIALHLSTEVSEIDRTNVVNGIPGLSVRRAETTVELGSGGTIMLAGLIKSNTLNSLNGMPGVQDLPVLGQLFKSKSFSRDESEVLIIVTPYLVDSYAQAEAIASAAAPTAFDKHLETSISAKPSETVPVTTRAAVPEKTSALTPDADSGKKTASLQSTPVKTVNPLSQRFIDNLRKSYGNHVPEKISSVEGFGYIVD